MRKNNIMKRDTLKVEITEMFMAQADHDRCFYGVIKRSKDTNGNPHVFSRIKINDGMIQACASDQKTLGKMLDEICIMVLDKKIHADKGARRYFCPNKPIHPLGDMIIRETFLN